jgi:hypothetical protein
VDAKGSYYRVEEHPTTVVVRGVLYSLWVALGVPVLPCVARMWGSAAARERGSATRPASFAVERTQDTPRFVGANMPCRSVG